MKLKHLFLLSYFLLSSTLLLGEDIFDAIAKGNMDAVEKCVSASPKSLDQKNDRDITPLHLALAKKQEKIAEFLINKGANINVLSTRSQISPFQVAMRNKFSKLAKLMLDKGLDIKIGGADGGTALHCAAQCGDVEMIDYLIAKGADIAAKDKNEAYPLHGGAVGLDEKNLEKLISPKMDISHQEKSVGYSPLMLAASFGNESGFFLLLKKSAKTDCFDKDGCSLLHHAAAGANPKIVEYLLKQKADVNAKAKYGATPLHVACGRNIMTNFPKEEELLPIVQLLLANGADLNAQDGLPNGGGIPDKEKMTPLEKATKEKLFKVKELLEKFANSKKK